MTRRLIALPLVLVGLLPVSRSACAQAEKAKAPQSSADTGTQSIEPPFRASLLVIKADWTKSSAAKEIDSDLHKAWDRDQPKLKLDLEHGPTVLFSTDAIAIYGEEHYRQLLAWLEVRQLVVHNDTFTVAYPGGEQNKYFTLSLKKDSEFFGIQPQGTVNEAFFTRKREFTWSVMPSTITQMPGLFFTRALDDYEQGRGEDKLHPTNPNQYDHCNFGITPLEDGQALIVHAFPALQDAEFLNAAQRKGLLALVVVEKHPSTSKAKAEPRLLLPDKMVRIKATRMQGSRSGGGFGTTPERQPPATGSLARSLITNKMMISWSEAKDIAWGYSKSLGKWAEQKLDPPATNTPPVVGDNVAVWRIGSSYYGFSGDAGRWDILRLSEDRTPPPVLDTDFARVHDGDDVYTFAAATGRWSSPKDAPSAAQNESGESPIKVFSLRNIKAAAAERIIRELLGDRLGSMAVDERTNSLIVTAPRRVSRTEADNLLEIVYALLIRLDEPEERTATSSTTQAARAPVAELQGRYQALEEAAAALATRIRELQSASPPDKAQLDKLRSQLHRAVTDAFATRQSLHQAEAAQLQARVTAIQQDLRTRQKISDKIVDRRVQDLLNPDLQWERGPLAQKDGRSVTSTSTGGEKPPPAKEQPKVTVGTWWGPESEQIFQALGLQVQKLTSDDAPEPKYVGALRITAIDPAGPAGELRVGDLIVSLQTTGSGGRGSGPRRATLHIRRGDETIQATVEFPAAARAGESDAKSSPEPISAKRTPAIAFTIGRAGEANTLRSPDDFRDQLRNLEDVLRLAEQTDVSRFAGQTPEEKVKDKQRIVETRRRDLVFLRDEYSAQLRLLELELQDAQSALDSAQRQHEAAKQRFNIGLDTSDNLLSHERAVQESKHRVARVSTLLDLYRKAAPESTTTSSPAESIPTAPAAP